MTEIDGVGVELNAPFKLADDSQEALDTTWEKIGRQFESIDQENAIKMREFLVDNLT